MFFFPANHFTSNNAACQYTAKSAAKFSVVSGVPDKLGSHQTTTRGSAKVSWPDWYYGMAVFGIFRPEGQAAVLVIPGLK